jgi:hypothetical protein
MEHFKKLMGLLLLVALFASCATTSKQRGKALNFFAEHPEELATLCSNTYPVTAKQGKDSVRIDTVYSPGEVIPCPPADTVKGKNGKDSIIPKSVTCPPAKTITIEHSRVDTVPDVAKIEALQAKINDLTGQLAASKAETKIAKEGQENAEKTASTRLWLFIAAGGVVAAGAVLKFKGII